MKLYQIFFYELPRKGIDPYQPDFLNSNEIYKWPYILIEVVVKLERTFSSLGYEEYHSLHSKYTNVIVLLKENISLDLCLNQVNDGAELWLYLNLFWIFLK